MCAQHAQDKPAAAGGWLRRNGAVIVIALAAVAVVALAMKLPRRRREAPPTEAPAVNVVVMKVTAQPELADTFDLPAVVEPNRVVKVAAEVPGRVERIIPKEGDTVKAGELLVELNADLLRAEYEGAAAQAKYDQAEYDRKSSLVKGGAAPGRDLDEASARLAISKARLDEARARLERTRILAPIGGVLNDLLVEQGEYVQPGMSVAEIVDSETARVAVDIPERDISFFSVGRKAEVFVTAAGQERSLSGTITFISELAHPQTRSTRVEIAVPNRERLLRSGQIVRVRLTRRILKDVVMIPLLAVIPLEDSKAVYVVNSDTAQRREVQLGIIRGDRIQVTRGLQPGDLLIVAGHRFVGPGQKVNVIADRGP